MAGFGGPSVGFSRALIARKWSKQGYSSWMWPYGEGGRESAWDGGASQQDPRAVGPLVLTDMQRPSRMAA
jgi:hypothetical protein